MLQKETCHKDIMSFSGLLYPTLFMFYKTLQTILEAWNTLHHFLFLDKGWLLQDKQKNVLGYFFVEEGGRRATLIFCSLILFACAVASLVNFGGQVKLEKWGLDALLLPLSCVKINDSECTRMERRTEVPISYHHHMIHQEKQSCLILLCLSDTSYIITLTGHVYNNRPPF